MGLINTNGKYNNSKINESQNESIYDESEYSIQFNKLKSQETNEQTETTESTIKFDTNEKKYPFKFEWTEGGYEVKIAGSFLNNWKKLINMKKNLTTGFHEIILDIPKGIHQFKFIVDSKWVCSSKYKTINENNNLNNIIDFTNFNLYENINEDKNIIEDKILKNKKIKANKKKIMNNSINYSCNNEKYNDLDNVPPEIPFLYSNIFNLINQSKPNYLKNNSQEYSNNDISKSQIQNNAYKTIKNIPHDKLSHICYNIATFNNDCKNKFIVTSITKRNKHKLLTIIYYRPKEY